MIHYTSISNRCSEKGLPPNPRPPFSRRGCMGFSGEHAKGKTAAIPAESPTAPEQCRKGPLPFGMFQPHFDFPRRARAGFPQQRHAVLDAQREECRRSPGQLTFYRVLIFSRHYIHWQRPHR